jgi:tetratricopeptide (TPR) repeat protein
MLLASNTVYVGPGQKTEMAIDRIPDKPDKIMAEEWSRLEELYRIGKKPQVVLMIKNTPDRVRQLLAPCAIYVSDEKPRDIPREFELVVRKIEEALKSGDDSKHLDAITLLEKMVSEHPNPKYGPQFLLYIGSYYEYMARHTQAIRAFQRVLDEYANSPLASIAQAAIGVIYKEKIGDSVKAREAFSKVLKNYYDSLEAIFAEEELGIRKIA